MWYRLRQAVREARPTREAGTRLPRDVIASVWANPVATAFGALAALWTWAYSRMLLVEYENFRTTDYDLGVFDQYIWLLLQGEPESSIRGLHFVEHHANFGFVLLVPFYLLGAGPPFLNFLQVAAVAVGSVGIYRIARHYDLPPTHAALCGSMLLVNSSVSWILFESFHPEVMAVPSIIFGWYFAIQRRWVPFLLVLLVGLSWKEDVSLAVVGLGMALAFRRPFSAWLKPAAGTMALGTAWFFGVTLLVMPLFADGTVHYSGNFALGDSPTEVATTAVTEPSLVREQLRQADALGYGRDLAATFGLIPLFAPTHLLIGLPQALVNLLSVHHYTQSLRFHYAIMPVVSMSIGFVEVVRRVPWPSARRALLGLGFAAGLATATAWGTSPLGRYHTERPWIGSDEPRIEAFENAAAVPRPGDPIVTTNNLTTHLSHRERIYTFPNPWIPSNWGLKDRKPDDPLALHWLLVDTWTLGDGPQRQLFESLLANGVYEVRSDEQGIIVAERSEAYRDQRLVYVPPMTGWSSDQVEDWFSDRPFLDIVRDDTIIGDGECDAMNAVTTRPGSGFFSASVDRPLELTVDWQCPFEPVG